MMKACQYERRFLSRGIQPHVYAIRESNGFDPHMIDFFTDGQKQLKNAMNSLVSDLHDAKEYGSILTVTPVDFPALYARFAEIRNENPNMYTYQILDELLPFVQVAEAMAQKYHIVCTNPPYMGNGDMNSKLSDYIRKKYEIAKIDLYAAFMLKCQRIVRKNYYQAMITMQSWMNLGAFAKLRKKICCNADIAFLWELDDTLLGIAYQTSAFVFRNGRIKGYHGNYQVASKNDYAVFGEDMFRSINLKSYKACQDDYLKLEGTPIAFALGGKSVNAYISSKTLSDVMTTREGMTTGNNDEFLRLWFEVEKAKLDKKWFPYNKGGEYRKWYGNDEYVVNWENDGATIKAFKDKKTGRIRSHNYNGDYSFKKGITWSAFSSRGATFRISDDKFLFDSKGSKGFCCEKYLLYILGFLNGTVGQHYLNFFAGAKDKKPGHIVSLPFIYDSERKDDINKLVAECISIEKEDWDFFEISWDFQKHPMICHTSTIADAYAQWQLECFDHFDRLKSNEEELNRIFINIYGLQDELTPGEEDKDITVRKADLSRDIRSFVSYAVGCMFGRYSLDMDGLAYAGGDWDSSKYKTFIPDKDAIIPITDDEYFMDDIVGRLAEFVKTVYGADTLEENLKFIADALDEKGSTSREVIRNYFLNDFFKDHCKIYQKRPIYWLFDSGKKNGFKCLAYMHRYRPDTIARIRTDYVHEQQARYRTAISDLERQINGASTSDRVRLNKQLTKLKDQAEETRLYEEKIHHLADQMISIDLDDGVKHNYAIFQDVLAKIK